MLDARSLPVQSSITGAAYLRAAVPGPVCWRDASSDNHMTTISRCRFFDGFEPFDDVGHGSSARCGARRCVRYSTAALHACK